MNQQPDSYHRILESARDLMYASTYSDVGVAEICDHANVTKGSFYHFFKSKQELGISVINAYFADIKENILDEAFSTNLPPLERLKKFAEMITDAQTHLYEQSGQVLGCPFGNMATEMSTQDEKIRVRLVRMFEKLQQQVLETLREAANNGDLQATDIETKAEAFIAFFEGSMLLAKTRNDPTILQRLLPTAVDQLLQS